MSRKPRKVALFQMGASFAITAFFVMNTHVTLNDLKYDSYEDNYLKSQPILNTAANDVETAVIISSSWIPSHPSTNMTDKVLKSIESNIIGLSPLAPIFITIDTFVHETMFNTLLQDPNIPAKLEALEQYSTNLFERYFSNPRIHILPGMNNLHIAGSVMKAMNLMEKKYPKIEFVYYVQHDFQFVKNVDHVALTKAMKANPNTLNLVRFLYKSERRSGNCGNSTHIFFEHTLPVNQAYEGEMVPKWTETTLELVPTWKYSDNNHMARFHWYKDLIASLISLRRPPEFPLQVKAKARCATNNSLGLYQYPDIVLAHLDGKNSKPQT
eukprot:CCRYP_017398-RB/>CCRYP_017398-RB protein AED:0.04 eAED:0.04 QI:338/1/1/1/0.5/0.33/3/1722/325